MIKENGIKGNQNEICRQKLTGAWRDKLMCFTYKEGKTFSYSVVQEYEWKTVVNGR